MRLAAPCKKSSLAKHVHACGRELPCPIIIWGHVRLPNAWLHGCDVRCMCASASVRMRTAQHPRLSNGTRLEVPCSLHPAGEKEIHIAPMALRRLLSRMILAKSSDKGSSSLMLRPPLRRLTSPSTLSFSTLSRVPRSLRLSRPTRPPVHRTKTVKSEDSPPHRV